MDTSQVAVIIPCYNSYTTIGDIVADVKKYVSDVIVVNDGSQDQSAEYASYSGAKVISLGENRGVGKAIQTGIQVALKMEKEIIITIDADAAHNPANILSLLKYHLNSDFILTIGNRWSNYDIHIPSQKWWANQFASTLINKISSTDIPDVACGFRIFNRQFAKNLVNSSMADGFGFIYQTIFIAKSLGQIGFAPVDVRYNANFLLATKQSELLHLLEISQKYCSDIDLRETIDEMKKAVVLFKKIDLKLQNKSFIDYIVLYPLMNQQSYLFQWQHPDFVNEVTNFYEI